MYAQVALERGKDVNKKVSMRQFQAYKCLTLGIAEALLAQHPACEATSTISAVLHVISHMSSLYISFFKYQSTVVSIVCQRCVPKDEHPLSCIVSRTTSGATEDIATSRSKDKFPAGPSTGLVHAISVL